MGPPRFRYATLIAKKEISNVWKLIIKRKEKKISEPGLDPGTYGLWAHYTSATPL